VNRDLAVVAPDPDTFGRHFSLVQDFVSSHPGSQAALLDTAREEPEAMTMSIVALGAVLLDIAAGAFRLTPEQMLDKVAQGIHRLRDDERPAL
jgi:hypothetical protein